ncbi:hypothetical protein [Bifidobacterium sp. SO1]|uniref:hypothetical protein n=1 Tax=Bifidobacterium sp. SO1 TaxID=2809029 RepID=UPI001BDD1C2D|nr:hypothetical protein [Bifidobacterium sp. SO1]MBT1162205.1 hypothetical protein [Bifidobacterium sp. SO1]
MTPENWNANVATLTKAINEELGNNAHGFMDIDIHNRSAVGAYTNNTTVIIIECGISGNPILDEPTNWVTLSRTAYDTNRPDLKDYAYGMPRELVEEICDVEDTEESDAFTQAMVAIER